MTNMISNFENILCMFQQIDSLKENLFKPKNKSFPNLEKINNKWMIKVFQFWYDKTLEQKCEIVENYQQNLQQTLDQLKTKTDYYQQQDPLRKVLDCLKTEWKNDSKTNNFEVSDVNSFVSFFAWFCTFSSNSFKMKLFFQATFKSKCCPLDSDKDVERFHYESIENLFFDVAKQDFVYFFRLLQEDTQQLMYEKWFAYQKNKIKQSKI